MTGQLIPNIIGGTIFTTIYGKDVQGIVKKVFGEAMDGDATDMNTKVWFRYKSIEGRSCIEMEVCL